MYKVSLSILSRCDGIDADVKGEQYLPPAAGGWRGGPAAVGLMRAGSNNLRDFKKVLAP